MGINSTLGNITLPVFADNLRIPFQFRYPLGNFAANLFAALGRQTPDISGAGLRPNSLIAPHLLDCLFGTYALDDNPVGGNHHTCPILSGTAVDVDGL